MTEFKVLYGDTDSLFVDLKVADHKDPNRDLGLGREVCDRINARLADHVNERFGVASFLELELENSTTVFCFRPCGGTASGAGQRVTRG